MENSTPKKSTRRRKRTSPLQTINDATPVVEEKIVETPAPEPTPEPTPEPAPAPTLVKPWEIVRPMPKPSTGWQRGQKWR